MCESSGDCGGEAKAARTKKSAATDRAFIVGKLLRKGKITQQERVREGRWQPHLRLFSGAVPTIWDQPELRIRSGLGGTYVAPLQCRVTVRRDVKGGALRSGSLRR